VCCYARGRVCALLCWGTGMCYTRDGCVVMLGTDVCYARGRACVFVLGDGCVFLC